MSDDYLEPPPYLTELVKSNPQADTAWKEWLSKLQRYVVNNMSNDFYLEVAQGRKTGYTTIHKFGSVVLGGTSLTPVCQGGFYRTPQSSATVELCCWSDDANDTAAGSGAREVTIQYLDSSGVEQTATMATNGTSESSQTVTGVWRMYRAWVSKSGTYATQTAASQAGTITIAVTDGAKGGDVWTKIPEIGTTGMGVGQSLIGSYTVPAGKTAYILSTTMTVDSNKSVDLYFYARTNIDETSAPYSGTLRIKNFYAGVSGENHIEHKTYEAYSELTDIGYMALGALNDEVSVEFELLLVNN